MTMVARKTIFALSGIGVLFFYLISLVLAPMSHLHPREHHPGATNTGYHSHVEPFAAHTSDHEDDDREDAAPHHFSETFALFEAMVGIVQVNPGDIINATTFSHLLVLFIQSSVESDSNQFDWQDVFNWSALQFQQEYSILAATNLSPPQG